VALAHSYTGKRAAVAMKQVGLNVAADPFMRTAYLGVKGGLVLVVADDPGPHSSQNEQDSRQFAQFAASRCSTRPPRRGSRHGGRGLRPLRETGAAGDAAADHALCHARQNIARVSRRPLVVPPLSARTRPLGGHPGVSAGPAPELNGRSTGCCGRTLSARCFSLVTGRSQARVVAAASAMHRGRPAGGAGPARPASTCSRCACLPPACGFIAELQGPPIEGCCSSKRPTGDRGAAGAPRPVRAR